MKAIFTMMLTLCGLSLFSQIQLDSIVHADPFTNEIYSKFTFGYENGILNSYSEDIDDFLVEIDISYNTEGNYDILDFDIDGEPGTFQLVYDDNLKIDSMIRIFESTSTYSVFEYFYENGQLSEFILSFVSDGESEISWRREFDYINGALDKAQDFDVAGSSESLVYIYNYLYDSFGKMTVQELNNPNGKIEKDSFSYNSDGSILDYYKTIFPDDIVLDPELIEDYESDATINFDNILNGAAFLEFLYIYGNIQNLGIYIPMKYGNKVDKSNSADDYDDESITTWYYSSYVGTNERVATTPISVYPNPTVDQIRIESEETMTKFYIYDFGGALISEGTPGKSNRIEVDQLVAGSYTVICADKEDKHYFSQFVKQ